MMSSPGTFASPNNLRPVWTFAHFLLQDEPFFRSLFGPTNLNEYTSRSVFPEISEQRAYPSPWGMAALTFHPSPPSPFQSTRIEHKTGKAWISPVFPVG